MSDKMTSAENALEMLGISLDEAIAADEAVMARPPRDNRVCICGHAVNRHQLPAGLVDCRPSRMMCPCKQIRPVLEVEDTRLFLRKTTGAGVEHALVRGMVALAGAGKEAKWLEPLVCDVCQGTDSVQPVPMSASLQPVYEPSPLTALLCRECREKL